MVDFVGPAVTERGVPASAVVKPVDTADDVLRACDFVAYAVQ
jgi:hypothetical protein